MSGTELDTDTLLAILSSLLHPLEFEQSILLDALIKSQGDIEAAASSVRAEPPRKKRKISNKAGLAGWLKGAGRASSPTPAKRDPSPSPAASTSHTLPREKDAKESSVSPKKPPSKVKSVTNAELMTLLRPPKSSDKSTKPQIPRHPPLTLISPEHVAEHTPCTLHNCVLPPELACRLFYTMLHSSRSWQRNKWWLFDRVVESPHRTSFYVRSNIDAKESENDMREVAQYWYNGRPTEPPPSFPAAMEEACEIIEHIVNAEMRKRTRFPLEWGGYPETDGEEPLLWRANVAASNCYEGAKESVGFHSDQLTYLGPYPTIASLSLGVSRAFRLREVVPTDEKDKRTARTFNIPLRHNSLIIMHASTQEIFKHAIPVQNTIDMFRPPFPPSADLAEADEQGRLSEASSARINITFRFYRPDFRSQLTPRCRCDVPCILRPDMKNRYEEVSPTTNEDTGVRKPASKSEGKGRTSANASSKKDVVTKYWWTCYAGAQNDGQGCGYWKVMDVKAEGRGPFAGDVPTIATSSK